MCRKSRAPARQGRKRGRGCLLPQKPTQARPNPNYHHHGFAASYHRRSSMATTFQCHYIGPKHTKATDAQAPCNNFCTTWSQTVALATNVILLQQHLLTAADPRLADPHFAPAVSPVGVLRHSIRALKTLQRARAAAAAMGRRLLLSAAADRCTFANRPLAPTSELAQEADAVHTLSATANLPGILTLYPGVELCLETKVCSELGVVRGCPVLVEDILLPEHEPFLILHLLYRFLLCFAFLSFSIHKHVLFFAVCPFLPMLPLRYFDPGSSILPLAPDAFSSAPGRTLGNFTLPTHHRKDSILTLTKKVIFNCIDVNFRSPTHLPWPITICKDRLFLPSFWTWQNLPKWVLFLGLLIFSFPFRSKDTFAYLYPPKWAQDEYWIACLVLLSRVPSLDDILFLRLPNLHVQTTSATPMLTLQPRKRTPFDATTPPYTDFILTTFASPSPCLYLPHQTRRPYFSLVNSAVAPQPHHDSISILHGLYHFHFVQHNQTTFP